MNILIIEDHKCVSDGLKQIIKYSDIEAITDIANSLAEVREKLVLSEYDIVFLDINLSDGDGLEFCKEIHKNHPNIGVIMLTSYANAAVIDRAKRYGAKGYIIKSADSDEIIEGIKTVYNGNDFLCKDARSIYKKHSFPQQPTLTQREKQIIQLIIEGYSTKEIADKLFLGFETIRTYQKIIHAKLEVHSGPQLIKKAIEERLV